MSAGTLALTNGSTTVTGSSTVFQTDLAVNDFIVCKIGGTTYTLGVSTIGSNTALTLTQPFTGPTTSGVAWYAVPNQTLVGITTELAANLTTVYRSVLLNDANWMQFFSASGNINITLKDGTTVAGPSWNSVSSSLSGKAAKGANSDITSLTGLTTALSIGQGGTGQKTAAAAWSALAQYGNTAQTATVGNDPRLSTIDGNSGGTLTKGSTINFNADPTGTGTGTVNEVAMIRGVLNGRRGGEDSGGAATRLFLRETAGSDILAQLRVSGLNPSGVSTVAGFNFLYTGVGQASTWQNVSDMRLKENFKIVKNSLAAVLSWRGVTFSYRRSDEGYSGGPSVGLLVQDVEPFCPNAVAPIGTTYTYGNEVVTDAKALNTSGVSAAYHTEAIKMLFSLIELALTTPDKALEAIDGIKSTVVVPQDFV